MTTLLRPEIKDLPDRVKRLPIDERGYPVPWFVHWIDGKPEFRVVGQGKLYQAIRESLCWVCGDKLGKNVTFVIGPMCGINRTSSEPPSHLDCARFSARNCPFLTKPHMTRREGGIEHLKDNVAGFSIRRNPGATLLWTTRNPHIFGDGRGGILFHTGDPLSVEWYAEGRQATRAEVEESVRTGLPFLEEMAVKQEGAMEALAKAKAVFEKLYP